MNVTLPFRPRHALLALAMGAGLAAPAAAQSELLVTPGLGTLNDAIEGDTNRPADRVYVLQRGVYYGVNRQISNTGYTLRIKAADGDGTRPVLYRGPDNTGTTIGSRFLLFQDDAELDGIYVLGVDNSEGVAGIPIAVNGDGQRLTVTDCVFEGALSRFFEINSADTKVYVHDSHFRNYVREDGSSNGRAFDYRTIPADTLVIQNSTFANISGYAVRYDGTRLNYFKFDHNTLHTTGRDVTTNSLGEQVIEMEVTNNLFVNVNAFGEDSPSAAGEPNGVVRLDSLGAIPAGITEGDRRAVIANNGITTSQAILAYYAERTALGDSLMPFQIVNPAAQDYIDANPGATASDNGPVSVTFVDPPDLTDYVAFLRAFRDGAAEPPFWWFGDVEGQFPAEQPLPENYAYNTSSSAYTAAMGGFPLGDLNWFPQRKAEWEVFIKSDAEEGAPLPGTFALRGAYPNPSAGQATVRFDLGSAADVTVQVFDLLGREVLALNAGPVAAGADHRLTLGTDALPAGLYVYRVTAATAGSAEVLTGRITLVR